MTDVRWYTALALWKAVVFMEGNYKRAMAGSTDDPFLKTFGQGVVDLASWPRTWRCVARDGLLVDWGGVLTTDLFASFASFAEQEGLDTAQVRTCSATIAPRASC